MKPLLTRFILFYPILFALVDTEVLADEPSWYVKDYKSSSEWGFYCRSDADSEEKALYSARAQCALKLCQLFGMELDAESSTIETLNSVDVRSSVVERCPKIKVMGRQEKKKTTECDGALCVAFIFQTYPKSEYDKEYERLNRPAVSKVLEKTIIIREGNESFQDATPCKKLLTEFSQIRGESTTVLQKRISVLKSAERDCKNLDYRNVELQKELTGYLTQSISSRQTAAASYLSRVVLAKPKLAEQVVAYREYETANLSAEKKSTEIMKSLHEHFDELFWGSAGNMEKYLQELKTCKASSEIVLKWPPVLGGDMVVCKSHTQTKEEVCQTTNHLFLRAQFIGCVCRVGAPSHSQICQQTMMQFFDDVCKEHMDSECFRQLTKKTAERMKVDIRFQMAF